MNCPRCNSERAFYLSIKGMVYGLGYIVCHECGLSLPARHEIVDVVDGTAKVRTFSVDEDRLIECRGYDKCEYYRAWWEEFGRDRGKRYCPYDLKGGCFRDLAIRHAKGMI